MSDLSTLADLLDTALAAEDYAGALTLILRIKGRKMCSPIQVQHGTERIVFSDADLASLETSVRQKLSGSQGITQVRLVRHRPTEDDQ